ncbi:serine hydrolase domain-containing protein [Rhodococcoides yunnanense]|uniref:serine hydrolase domain-containing protein n=1 Tax=Rhodococcoides yunnanense TaxID=278209 RepID=UPI000932B065|nr:serine hydrolase domain-containing protein [Rhodococcus yunnanensis]
MASTQKEETSRSSSSALLRDALGRSIELGERGIQVAVTVGGDLVAEASAGIADPGGRQVDARTLFPIFSVTKAATAVSAHVQIERGLIDPDEPIAAYWPEFARHGKDRITLGHVLAHQSGIPQMPPTVTPELMCDWDWMIDQIEDFRPYFEPGTVNAYQAIVFGWLVGEVVRRTDPQGRPFGRFVREEIFAPIGIDDFWMGIRPEDIPRVGVLVSDLEGPGGVAVEGATEVSVAAKPAAIGLDAPVHNRHDVWQGCLPGTGGIASASAVVRLFALLAGEGELGGRRLLSPARVRDLLRPRDMSEIPDMVLVGGNRWSPPLGAGGFWHGGTVFGDGPGVLCHAGLGNSIGFADIDKGYAVGLTHNRLFTDGSVMGEHPFAAIVAAVERIVESHSSQQQRS